MRRSEVLNAIEKRAEQSHEVWPSERDRATLLAELRSFSAENTAQAARIEELETEVRSNQDLRNQGYERIGVLQEERAAAVRRIEELERALREWEERRKTLPVPQSLAPPEKAYAQGYLDGVDDSLAAFRAVLEPTEDQ